MRRSPSLRFPGVSMSPPRWHGRRPGGDARPAASGTKGPRAIGDASGWMARGRGAGYAGAPAAEALAPGPAPRLRWTAGAESGVHQAGKRGISRVGAYLTVGSPPGTVRAPLDAYGSTSETAEGHILQRGLGVIP